MMNRTVRTILKHKEEWADKTHDIGRLYAVEQGGEDRDDRIAKGNHA